jgi:hypothetical protein
MAYPSEQKDLWDSLDPDDDDETKKKDILVDTGIKLAEISPNEMVTYDMNNEKMVYDQTDSLSASLVFREQIVIAAYKVAEYVPDLSNNKYSTFWKKQVSVITDEILRFGTLSHQLFGQDRDGIRYQYRSSKIRTGSISGSRYYEN